MLKLNVLKLTWFQSWKFINWISIRFVKIERKLYSKIWRYCKKRKKYCIRILRWSKEFEKRCKKTSKEVLESRIKNLEVICVAWNLNIFAGKVVLKSCAGKFGSVRGNWIFKKKKNCVRKLHEKFENITFHEIWICEDEIAFGKFCWPEIGNMLRFVEFSSHFPYWLFFFKLPINFHDYY